MPIPQVDLDRGLGRFDGSRAKSPQLSVTRRRTCTTRGAELKMYQPSEGEACGDRDR
jgi:hypothetical protein